MSKKNKKDILIIENLAKFETLINKDHTHHDINMMVMPGTLEDKHKNCETIPALRRQFNLIYLLNEGEHDVKLGAEHCWLKPNDLVIVPENTVYASDHIQNCKGYCIHFKTEFMQPVLENTLHEDFPFFQFESEHIINITNEQNLLIQQAFRDIIEEHKRYSPEHNNLLRNYIQILLHRIKEIHSNKIKSTIGNLSNHDKIAIRFKQLVEKNFIANRHVSNYADMLHVSTRHLSEIIKKSTGRTPLNIIHDMLFLEAKVLMKATDKSISEIAYSLNFQDQAHFSHFIKDRTKRSPSSLRKTL